MQTAALKLFDLPGGVSPKHKGQLAADGTLPTAGEQNFGLLLNALAVPAGITEKNSSTESNINEAATNVTESDDSALSLLIENKQAGLDKSGKNLNTATNLKVDTLFSLEEFLTKNVKSELVDFSETISVKGDKVSGGKFADFINMSDGVRNSNPLVTLNGERQTLQPGQSITLSNLTDKPPISDRAVSELNLKEINIKSGHSEAKSIEQQRPVSPELGQIIKLANQKNDFDSTIRQTQINNTTNSEVAFTEESSVENGFENIKPQVDSSDKSHKSNKADTNKSDAKDFDSQLNNKIGENKSAGEMKNSTDVKTTSVNQTDKSNTIESKINQPVRIEVPENLKFNADPKNHSIMIKIEPEHLGPARLDLIMRHDAITAKLTVETPEAKAVLENSIHSLKEQFAKADIKVEQIQINVRGETNYNQMFDRQPQWQKFNFNNHTRFNENEILENFVTPGQPLIANQVNYIGSNGVNILA